MAQIFISYGGAWREGENPFPGLEPFTAALSRVFFGRTAQAREVANRLRAIGSGGGMLAIVGPSGCGKSSLLNAAVAPLLASDPAWLTVTSLVPGSDPLLELVRTLAAAATRVGLTWSASDVRHRLEAGGDGLHRIADDLLAAGPSTPQRRLLVVVDQTAEHVAPVDRLGAEQEVRADATEAAAGYLQFRVDLVVVKFQRWMPEQCDDHRARADEPEPSNGAATMYPYPVSARASRTS